MCSGKDMLEASCERIYFSGDHHYMVRMVNVDTETNQVKC